VKKTSLILLGLFLAVLSLTGCQKAKGVLEACHSYEHMRACEAHLLDRIPVQIDCKKIQAKFEDCPQKDIDYAAEAFAKDEKHLCNMKKAEELKDFKPSFDAKKISPICYQAASDCGPECFQTGLDDIP